MWTVWSARRCVLSRDGIQQGLGDLLAPEIEELLEQRLNQDVRLALSNLMDPEIADVLSSLPGKSMVIAFCLLSAERQADVFTFLPTDQQDELLAQLSGDQLAELFNTMDPDDRAEVFDEMPSRLASKMLGLLKPEEREQTRMMLAYPADSVGRIMTPDFLTVRPDWTVRMALDHVRKFGRDAESIETLYVTDEKGHLLDDVRLRNLLLVEPSTTIRALMDSQFVSLQASDDREKAVEAMQRYDRPVIAVLNDASRLVGIVTFDDIADVAQEETTEDIQKMGGMQALDDPYLAVSLFELVRKRGMWLLLLFVGGTLTMSVMTRFSTLLENATFLKLFLPLIIASGGNSGSQASTLIIRALAIGEVRLNDWWIVFRREFACGMLLGLGLGLVGAGLVVARRYFNLSDYAADAASVAMTVGGAVVGVVLWGTTVGAMLPFILRRIGVDPATLSAPLLATLVDVTGLMIYFTVAIFVLPGSML